MTRRGRETDAPAGVFQNARHAIGDFQCRPGPGVRDSDDEVADAAVTAAIAPRRDAGANDETAAARHGVTRDPGELYDGEGELIATESHEREGRVELQFDRHRRAEHR